MEFGNVVLLCKNWYKTRSGNRPDLFWMDMAHAIHADGWSPLSKNDVAQWCLHRMDELRDDTLYHNKERVSLTSIFNDVNRYIERCSWYENVIPSYEDGIIWAFRTIVSDMSNKSFSEGVFPNQNILPFNLESAWYDDGRYSKCPKLYCSEMNYDFIKRASDTLQFQNKQIVDVNEYDYVESMLKKESWKDVQIELGEDNLNDCIEVVMTGLDLKRNTCEQTGLFKLGKFSYCKDISMCNAPDKKYVVRISKQWRSWDEYQEVEFIVKSIKEL